MDKEIETDVAVGAVVSEGERRSSTLSTARDEGAVGALAHTARALEADTPAEFAPVGWVQAAQLASDRHDVLSL